MVLITGCPSEPLRQMYFGVRCDGLRFIIEILFPYLPTVPENYNAHRSGIVILGQCNVAFLM